VKQVPELIIRFSLGGCSGTLLSGRYDLDGDQESSAVFTTPPVGTPPKIGGECEAGTTTNSFLSLFRKRFMHPILGFIQTHFLEVRLHLELCKNQLDNKLLYTQGGNNFSRFEDAGSKVFLGLSGTLAGRRS